MPHCRRRYWAISDKDLPLQTLIVAGESCVA